MLWKDVIAESYNFERVLKMGKGISVEFKHCENNFGLDVFETICSVANRTGGQIFLVL